MTLQQMIYAVTIAKDHSMNKAAQELFLSQSSLSVSISNLESEIGIRIFLRSNRGIQITPEGEEFLTYARQIVNQYRLAEEKYVLKKETKKSFSVSSQHYSFAVKAFIAMARQFGPDQYSLGIYECKTMEIIENVRNFKSEIGLLYLDDFNRDPLQRIFHDNGLEFHSLFDTRVFVFLAKSHPLADREKLTLEDLEPYPCLSFDQGENQTFYLSEEVFSTYDYRQLIKASDRATFLNLMLGLNGYTLCSGILCEDLNGEEYEAIPLETDKIMHIGYIKRKDHELTPLGQMYLEEVSKCQENVL